MCPWLPKPQEDHKKLCEAEPSSGILQQPKTAAFSSGSGGELMISSPTDLPRKGLVEGGWESILYSQHAPATPTYTPTVSWAPVRLSLLLIAWVVSEPRLGFVCALRGVKGDPQK